MSGHGGSSGDCNTDHLYGYIAIPVVFVLSVAGTLLPALIQRFRPKWDVLHNPVFKFFQGLAGGFIIGVGFVHSFAEGSEVLSSEELVAEGYLPEYAWGGFFALMGVLCTWSVEIAIGMVLLRRRQRVTTATGGAESPHHHHSEPSRDDVEEASVSDDTAVLEPPGAAHAKPSLQLKQHLSMTDFPLNSPAAVRDAIQLSNTGQHHHGHGEHGAGGCLVDSLADVLQQEQRIRNYTSLTILLFGLSFHSIFVGFAIGLSNDRALFIAILAHQFFEALALGFHTVKSQIRDFWFVALLVLVFSSTAPVGTGIGIGIADSLCNDSHTYEVVEGVFNSFSAGILIYVGCVHMIADEFRKPEVTDRPLVGFLVWLGVITGSALMCIIGIWA